MSFRPGFRRNNSLAAEAEAEAASVHALPAADLRLAGTSIHLHVVLVLNWIPQTSRLCVGGGGGVFSVLMNVPQKILEIFRSVRVFCRRRRGPEPSAVTLQDNEFTGGACFRRSAAEGLAAVCSWSLMRSC